METIPNNSTIENAYLKLEDLDDILNEDGYFCLGHGTGRIGNSDEVVNSIFNNGLKTKDNSLYYTTIGLDTSNLEALNIKLETWPHQNSQKIILIRIPIKYINLFGDSADLDGERYGAFYNEKRSQNGKVTYYLEPKYIIGCYDAQKKLVLLNKKFEKDLNNETLHILESKYKKTLEKTKRRIKRQEKILNNLNNYNSEPQTENNQMGTNVDYDINDFDDDIDWGLEQDINHKKNSN